MQGCDNFDIILASLYKFLMTYSSLIVVISITLTATWKQNEKITIKHLSFVTEWTLGERDLQGEPRRTATH